MFFSFGKITDLTPILKSEKFMNDNKDGKVSAKDAVHVAEDAKKYYAACLTAIQDGHLEGAYYALQDANRSHYPIKKAEFDAIKQYYDLIEHNCFEEASKVLTAAIAAKNAVATAISEAGIDYLGKYCHEARDVELKKGYLAKAARLLSHYSVFATAKLTIEKNLQNREDVIGNCKMMLDLLRISEGVRSETVVKAWIDQFNQEHYKQLFTAIEHGDLATAAAHFLILQQLKYPLTAGIQQYFTAVQQHDSKAADARLKAAVAAKDVIAVHIDAVGKKYMAAYVHDQKTEESEGAINLLGGMEIFAQAAAMVERHDMVAGYRLMLNIFNLYKTKGDENNQIMISNLIDDFFSRHASDNVGYQALHAQDSNLAFDLEEASWYWAIEAKSMVR